MRTPRWPQFLTLSLRPDSGSTVETLGRTFTPSEVREEGDSVMVRVGEGDGAAIFRAALRDGSLVGALTQGRDTLPFSLRRMPASSRSARYPQAQRASPATARTAAGRPRIQPAVPVAPGPRTWPAR